MANREGRSTTLPLRYIDPAISAMELYASAVIRLLGRTEGNLFLDDFLGIGVGVSATENFNRISEAEL